MNGLIKHKLELLPSNPGCYLHKDKFGNIIYVGKAKNLKNRVRSYFRGSHDTKTELLVSEIADFEFIVTESNIEALLLEINLIQENMPKFNIRQMCIRDRVFYQHQLPLHVIIWMLELWHILIL